MALNKVRYEDLKAQENRIDFDAAATHIAKEKLHAAPEANRFTEKYNEKEAEKAIDWSINACKFLMDK